MSRPTTVECFWRRVQADRTTGCWEWTGYRLPGGYGYISTRLKPTASGTRLVHRVAYELVIGPIPDGKVLDHLCRNRACVNPVHLEPVTTKENAERGLHGVLRTHCNYGHELTPENTQYDQRRNCRRCRTCAREWDRRAKAKRRQERAA